jgi:hypothetical protein
MAKQHINTGVAADDGTGDTLRQAGIKINSNFDELYAALASSQNINSIIGGAGISVENNAGVVTITNTAANPVINANSLVGTVLASNVIGSSLTSVGTLVGLTVTNPIVGSITGAAPAISLSGTTLAPNIVSSSLTSLGTLTSLTVTNPISGSITGSAPAANLTGTTLSSSIVNSSLTSVGNLVSLSIGGTVQKSNNNISCPPGVATVVYTSSAQFEHALRLFVLAEGLEEGGAPDWETQACDIIAVKGYNIDDVNVSVFGVTYSGLGSLATFDGQWNLSTNRIEITCTPVSTIDPVEVSVFATELTSTK